MVGGDEQSFERALPVLSPMANKVTHCGDLGTGLAAKISNKYVGCSEAKVATPDANAVQPVTWYHHARIKVRHCRLGQFRIRISGLTFSSEATLLGTTLGVKPQVLADIINNSTGECWSSKVSSCYHIMMPSTADTAHLGQPPRPGRQGWRGLASSSA